MDKTCAFCLNWDGKETSYMAECLAKAGMQRRTQFDETCRAWTPGIDEEPGTTQVTSETDHGYVLAGGPSPIVMTISSAQSSLSDSLEMFKRSLNASAKALAEAVMADRKRFFHFPFPNESELEFFTIPRQSAQEQVSYAFHVSQARNEISFYSIREYRCIDCGKPFYGEYGLGLCKDCLGRWI